MLQVGRGGSLTTEAQKCTECLQVGFKLTCIVCGLMCLSPLSNFIKVLESSNKNIQCSGVCYVSTGLAVLEFWVISLILCETGIVCMHCHAWSEFSLGMLFFEDSV